MKSKVIKIFKNLNITYNNQSSSLEHIKIDETIYDFIDFLESDSKNVKYTNYKKFRNEIEKQKRILNKIRNTYSVKSIQELVDKNGKVNINSICRDTGIHRKTLTTIFKYYKK